MSEKATSEVEWLSGKFAGWYGFHRWYARAKVSMFTKKNKKKGGTAYKSTNHCNGLTSYCLHFWPIWRRTEDRQEDNHRPSLKMLHLLNYLLAVQDKRIFRLFSNSSFYHCAFNWKWTAEDAAVSVGISYPSPMGLFDLISKICHLSDGIQIMQSVSLKWSQTL